MQLDTEHERYGDTIETLEETLAVLRNQSVSYPGSCASITVVTCYVVCNRLQGMMGFGNADKLSVQQLITIRDKGVMFQLTANRITGDGGAARK